MFQEEDFVSMSSGDGTSDIERDELYIGTDDERDEFYTGTDDERDELYTGTDDERDELTQTQDYRIRKPKQREFNTELDSKKYSADLRWNHEHIGNRKRKYQKKETDRSLVQKINKGTKSTDPRMRVISEESERAKRLKISSLPCVAGNRIISNLSRRNSATNYVENQTQETHPQLLSGCLENLASRNTRKEFTVRELLVSGFREVSPRNRFLHDLYPRDESGRLDELVYETLKKSEYRGALFIVVSHGVHWHILHDCCYTSNQCRCARIQLIESCIGKRYNRRNIKQFEYGFKHLELTIEYLQKEEERSIFHLTIGKFSWTRLPCKTGDFFNCFQGINKGIEPLEKEKKLIIVKDFVNCQSIRNNGIIDVHKEKARTGDTREKDPLKDENNLRFLYDFVNCKSMVDSGIFSSRSQRAEDIMSIIFQCACSPLSRIYETRHWMEGRYSFLPRRSSLLKTVLYNRCIELMGLSMIEMYKYFCTVNPDKLLFNAPEGRLGKYYYNMDESIKKMEQLLMFQFHNDDEIVQSFLIDLFNVINKRIPKKNTLFILAQPNSGNKWFFNSVVHFFLNFGEIRNVDGQLALQDVVNKRIILWDGPKIKPVFMGMIKTMLGGDTISVPVRRKANEHVARTPIIVLSDCDVFPHNEAFDSRLIRYKWKPFPQLESFEKHPLPMALYKLLEKWDIFNAANEDM